MMKPIRVEGADGESTVYVCLHWRTFPDRYATHPDGPEKLRDKRVIDGAEFQRYKVWEKECGIIRMEEGKCLTCTHVRRLEIMPHQVPKLIKLDGSGEWTPAVDVPTLQGAAQYRPKRTPKQAAQHSRQMQVESENAAARAEADKVVADAHEQADEILATAKAQKG